MTTFFATALKGYATSFTGIEKSIYRALGLSLIESTLIGILYFLPLYFVNELHFKITIAGVIISFYGIGTVIGGLLGGKLSDKVSPQLVTCFSLALQASMFLGLTVITSPLLLMLDLLLMGISSYAFITSNYIGILQQCHNDESKKLTALNFLSITANLGLGLSTLLMGFFFQKNLHIIFIISSLISLIGSILTSFKEKTVKSSPNEILSLKRENKKILLLVLSILFLVGFIIFQNTTYTIFISKSFPDLKLHGISFLFTLNCLLIVFFQAPLNKFFNRFDKLLIMGCGVFLLGFSMFMLNFIFTFAIAIAACIIRTIGEILFFPISQLLCYQYGDNRKKGYRLGIYRMVYASSRIISPASGTFIYTYLGSSILWMICGGIGCFGLILCAFYKFKNLS